MIRSSGRKTGRERWLLLVVIGSAALAGCKGDRAEDSVPLADAGIDLGRIRIEAIPAGGGVAQASAVLPRERAGRAFPTLSSAYVEIEYLLHGEANTYSGLPTETPRIHSRGNPYTTRILVRRPRDDARFSGRVFIEPFNTTFERDLDALWIHLGPLLEEDGDIWIGVSVRSLGAREARAFDPVRYADLDLPVNDYAWDVLRELGRLLKEGGDRSPLAELDVESLYLGGYSQSGVDTAAFLSAFHAITRMDDGSPVFDGYLPAAHGASVTRLRSGDSRVPGFEFSEMTPVDVPVIDLETQSDVQGFDVELLGLVLYRNRAGATVRREDSDAPGDLFRLYELAGAPHAERLDGCEGNGSSFPLTYFVQAVGQLLFAWAEDGSTPPRARRIELEVLDGVSKAAEDRYGNAMGGVRSPFVDVPLVDYDVHAEGGILCLLGGNETPLPPAALAARYRSLDAYMEEFTRSLDATIGAGFLRARDRTAILVDARARAAEGLGR